MPELRGTVNASWETMNELFGPPDRITSRDREGRVEWRLPGGTVLHDSTGSTRVQRVTCWAVRGWSAAAVDQVIGIAARADLFRDVVRAGRSARETIRLGS